MRPDNVEIIRGLQGHLMTVVAPELRSQFAQDSLQTVQMLLELLANDLDTAAESLAKDNRTLRELLSQARQALSAVPGGDALAGEIDAALAEEDEGALAVSALSERNRRLRGALERLLVACEGSLGEPGWEPLLPVRAAAYRHLREVAARGWSFWDVFSFRGMMARLRSQA